MAVEFNGTKSGSHSFTRNPDGTFSSNSKLELGTVTIVGEISGKFDGTRLVELTNELTTPGGKGKVVLKDGKLTVSQGTTSRSVDMPYKGDHYFANFYPELLAGTLRAVDFSKKQSQTVESFIVDGGSVISLKILPEQEKTTKAGIARLYRLTVTGIDVEYATDSNGNVVSMDVPAQKIRMVQEGWESLYIDPLAAYPELSQPTHKVVSEPSQNMKMRDGVTLVGDVYRPAEPGKYPVVLTRTPYGRGAAGVDGQFYASRGYVFVSQDCRGRGSSGGEWDPFVNEAKDGADTIGWIAKQPWCDGNVGMIGGSYGGLVQWAAATEKPAALKCIVPQVSPPDAMYNIPYDFGVFFLYGDVWWGKIVMGKDADMSNLRTPMENLAALKTLPLSKVDDALSDTAFLFYDKWLERDGSAKWPGYNYQSTLGKVEIPALHISGWWDGDGIGTKLNWEAMRAAGRKNQWLIYGPWTHAFNTTSRLGDIDYGPTAILELDSLYLRWFDTWLKGKSVGLERVPHVQAFVTGANKWIKQEDWPSATSTEKKLFLAADAPANGRTSRGQLLDQPAASQEPDRYSFNPANDEIPEGLGDNDVDNASTVAKFGKESNESLLYKTAPLPKAMAIGGPISLHLTFSTTARDTDLYGTLVDIDEKGVMRVIGRGGKIRGSYLGGFDKPRPLTPGKIYTADIQFWDVAHEFAKGHRLGVFIVGSEFPVYARNLGTGEPIKDATRMVVQSQTVYHDAAHPSFLKFRVLW